MGDRPVQRNPVVEGAAPPGAVGRPGGRVSADLRDAALPLLWLALGILASTAYLVGAALINVPALLIVPVYPQQAVVLSVLLLTPLRRWWLYVLATYALLVAAGWWLGLPPWFVLLGNVASVAEPLVGALLVRRWIPLPPRFARLREVSIYAACVVAAAALGASLGAALRVPLGSPYWPSWRAWFLSDVLASLLLAPTILLWIEAGPQGLRAPSRRRAVEAALLVAALLVVGFLVFGTRGESPDTALALLYLPVPVLLWAAVRFGPRGLATAVALLTTFAIAGVANGLGPFVERSTAANLVTLQLFLFAVGVPLFFLAVLVQERQEAQAALERSEARYRATQDQREQLTRELAHVTRVAALGELAASIAHELAQPLAAILANAQAGRRFLAAPGPAGPDLAELDAILADIGADDERATAVIDRLRALLRKSEAERAPLDLNAAVAETAGLVAPDAARRGVTLTLDLEPTLPPVVGDRVQLQQVVLNLLLNGLDAAGPVPGPQGDGRTSAGDGPRTTGPRATLAVRTRRAPGSAPAPGPPGPPGPPDAAGEAGQAVEVAVRDSGPGLDPAAADRLFEPFYTTKPGGLGMGLAISRTIAEAHGGALGAANSPAGGAEFVLALPVVPPPAPASDGPPDPRRPAAAGREGGGA